MLFWFDLVWRPPFDPGLKYTNLSIQKLKMRRTIAAFHPTLLALCYLLPAAAHTQPAYFQQEVNYRIEVSLDDRGHFLRGRADITYHNHAPEALDGLYFHLWPNAYRDNNTAFAHQQLRTGSTRFYFADAGSRGFIDSLAIQADGQPVSWAPDTENPDICWLPLARPLEPGDSVTISTPFRVKLPIVFSRLGHEGQAYQITQWYPKPAVYDREGWHPMPYLDMGEFYSEFGNYDVSITLPGNYVVAATGVLQTESERLFLEKRIAESTEQLDTVTQGVRRELFPPSSERLKTIRYTAENVHDFAWFADKRFLVQKEEVLMPSGRMVEAWAFFSKREQHLWKEASTYVGRALSFYSGLVGEYPYPHATAVQAALSAGGGMEYPMITNISLAGDARSLDEVITHEVGHNWFYGILGSNERVHAWMDEGINSYYDHRYSSTYYNGPEFSYLPEFMMAGTELDIFELAYLYQARRHLNQAPDTPSDELSEINYFLGAYELPARALRYLEQYLGTAPFDAAMQAYYRKWQFRHPQPDDFRAHIEATVGKPLPWLFEGILFSNKKQDYAVTGIRREGDSLMVVVRNRGNIAGPFTVSAMAGAEVAQESWVEGFEGEKTIALPAGPYTEVVLDRERATFDLYRKNNTIRLSGILKKVEPLQLHFFAGVENYSRSTIYWSPLLSWNNYDKLMPGLLLYNRIMPERRLEWALAPFYSTNGQALAGLGDIHYNFYPRGDDVQRIVLGFNARSFHYRRYAAAGELLRYTRWQPYLRINFAKPAASNIYKSLQVRGLWVSLQEPAFAADGGFLGKKRRTQFLQEASFFVENRSVLNPSALKVSLEHQQHENISLHDGRYIKASLEWNQAITYERGRNIDIRFFAGAFLYNTGREAGYIEPWAFSLIGQGYNDYRFDDYYLGRSDSDGLWLQQVNIREGGLKNVIGSGFTLGRSNNFIIAANFKAALPRKVLGKLPVKPYFDIGYFDNAMPTGKSDTFSSQLLWSGGLMLSFGNETAAVYFPLVNSKNIQDRYVERGNYWKRVAFSVNLQKLDPWRAVERLEF